MLHSYRARAAAGAAFALTLLAPHSVRAQATIKVNDSISVKIGFLSQTWADFTQNVRQDSSYSQDIFQRRMRLLVGANVGSHLSFFFETDNPNLGRTGPNNGAATGFTRSLGTGFITQDVYAEVKPTTSNAFMIDAGLQLVPLCRNCIGSAPALLALDYGAYSFLQNGPIGSSAGRDVGFQAKGYLAENKIEYRAGVFSGARLVNSGSATGVQQGSNSLRVAGRLAVELLDAEPMAYSIPETYFGKRKVLQVGVGGDAQGDYKAYSADAFFSYPIGTDGVTLLGTFIHYDGGRFFTALPKQNTFEAEAGYHFNTAKITPWVKFETRQFASSVSSIANQDESRFQVGGTYYVMGNNLNVKAAYTHGSYDRLALTGALPSLSQNGFTLQLQAFYY